MSVGAGKLRHRGTLQQRVAATPGDSASGEALDSWVDVAAVWMSVEPIRGRELFAAEQVQSPVDVRIRMRYRPGVTPQMRVVLNAVNYNIVSVIDPEERHAELELMCERGLNNG